MDSERTPRDWSWLWWTLPSIALCFVVYWNGIWAWFQQDDFAWLSLYSRVHQPSDLLSLVFAPAAQGTLRPFSERLFFIGLYSIFGLDALPFRVVVFTTQCIALVLIQLNVELLTGARWIGLLASLLWCSNSVLSWPLSWTAAYNQILCATVFLLALFFLQLYSKLGDRRYLVLQWVVFLAGFGVLELNVVYPLIAVGYAMLFAPNRAGSYAKMLPVSLMFAAIHFYVAPKSSSGTYALVVDWRLPSTFVSYWKNAFLPDTAPVLLGWPSLLFDYIRGVLAVLGAALLAQRIVLGDRVVAFGVFWFIVGVTPYLLVPNHISEYYLVVPTIGLAVGFSRALSGWRSLGRLQMIAIGLCGALWLITSWTIAWRWTAKSRQDSETMQTLILGVDEIRKVSPGRTIFLTGITDTIFWSGIYDRPFRLLKPSSPVFVSPTNAANLTQYPELANIQDYTLPARVAADILDNGRGVVYQLDQTALRNVTRKESRALNQMAATEGLPMKVRVGEAHYGTLLDTGWFEAEDGFRWMSKEASLWIHGPRSASEKLHVRGICATRQLAAGPIRLTVTINGQQNPPIGIAQCAVPWDVSFTVPALLVGKEKVGVTLAVDRIQQEPNGKRLLGLGITDVEIR